MGVGEMIETDDRGATAVPGVYAAGNVAHVAGQVLQAAAEGSRVGAVINADLVHEDASLAVAALPGDGPDDWDRRYGNEVQLFSGDPALRHSHGDDAIDALVGAVAPGGTLLVVGHDFDGVDHHHCGFDPTDYVQPADIARHLDDMWTLEVDETRPRIRPPGHHGPDLPDIVLRAQRHS